MFNTVQAAAAQTQSPKGQCCCYYFALVYRSIEGTVTVERRTDTDAGQRELEALLNLKVRYRTSFGLVLFFAFV
jgi:hypothetical protein